MVKKIILSFCLVFAAFLPIFSAVLPSFAEETGTRVLAVINDNILTTQDLDQRYALILRQLPKDLPQSEKDLLRRKTLNILIDEELKNQYAKKLGVSISDAEIKERFDLLAQRTENFSDIIKGLETAAEQQVRNDILWQKIINYRIKPRVVITNEEVDRLIDSLLRGSQTVERELSQIFLPAEDKKEEGQAQQRMQQVYDRLKEGASFKTMAQAFSDDQTSSQGGYLGWFSQGELSPVLESALKDTPVGGFTAPIRSAAGWHILRVENTRTSQVLNTAPTDQVYLLQLAMRLPKEDDSDATKAFKELVSRGKTLAGLEEILTEIKEDPAFQGSRELGWMNLEDVPSFIHQTVTNLKQGQQSDIITHEGSLYMFYVAKKRQKLSEKLELYRERVRERLVTSRVELMARRFMRDLRRKAFIDIKL